MKKKILFVCLFTLAIDQLSKVIVTSFLSLKESVSVIGNFFKITYVYNEGAAWGMLNGKTFLLIIVSFGALFYLSKEIIKYKENKMNIWGLGLLLGGILGNLLDRILYGYVRDFLDFRIFGYDFPIFNIADSAILIGVALLIIANNRGEKNESSSKQEQQSR